MYSPLSMQINYLPYLSCSVPKRPWPSSLDLQQKRCQLQAGREAGLFSPLHLGHTLGLAVSMSLCDDSSCGPYSLHQLMSGSKFSPPCLLRSGSGVCLPLLLVPGKQHPLIGSRIMTAL